MIDRKSPQMKSVKWILRLLASVILLQSLIFKRSAFFKKKKVCKLRIY